MIHQNSGKVYRLKLDHKLGYAFSEVYDFSDEYDFDGRIAYVFNLVVETSDELNDIDKIRNSGISLGPIRIVRLPNERGKGAWKFIGQSSDFLITQVPASKELRSLIIKHNNWNDFSEWYQSDLSVNGKAEFLDYEKVRGLETRILSSSEGVMIKFSMKRLIDIGKSVGDYYDLSERGNLNLYLRVINTYYPLEKTVELLNEINE